MQYEDQRDNKTPASYYLVATDKFMSGWGQAPGTSYVAYDITNLNQQQIDRLERWMDDRSDFIRVRFNVKLPRGGRGDHCSIYDAPAHVIGV